LSHECPRPAAGILPFALVENRLFGVAGKEHHLAGGSPLQAHAHPVCDQVKVDPVRTLIREVG